MSAAAAPLLAEFTVLNSVSDYRPFPGWSRRHCPMMGDRWASWTEGEGAGALPTSSVATITATAARRWTGSSGRPLLLMASGDYYGFTAAPPAANENVYVLREEGRKGAQCPAAAVGPQ